MPTSMNSEERHLARTLSQLIHCNHFLPERIDLEREALGAQFEAHHAEWNLSSDTGAEHPNITRLTKMTERLVRNLRQRCRTMTDWDAGDRTLYEDALGYYLYRHYRGHFLDLIRTTTNSVRTGRVVFFDQFAEDLSYFLAPVRAVTVEEAAYSFALFFQIERAFYHIFNSMVGTSPALARLRAAVWQSLFTHDLQRYRRGLFKRMSGLTTLVVGPSGTGKELVAQAIAFSGFVPFDLRRRCFERDYRTLFLPLNLSALAPTLIESELFGHRRGAFTGAVADHHGWLEVCPPGGTVFLDEIGETTATIQVKLLRVLQSRTFQRLGESTAREFKGKIIAATNRDLDCELRERRFREDFYYRLCSDVIVTPSLRDQLRERPADLERLVLFVARNACGQAEAEGVTAEVLDWIQRNLPADYAWPGNFRELEQCVRNIVVRGTYRPRSLAPSDATQSLLEGVRTGTLTAESLLARYCALVYRQTRSLEQTAQRLALDRRTVRAKIRALSPGNYTTFRESSSTKRFRARKSAGLLSSK